jgi:hypothetical protein
MPQEHLGDVAQLRGRALDRPGADVLEHLAEQLLARLTSPLDPRHPQILDLTQPLARQRGLTDAGRAAQQQGLKVLA